MSVAHVLRRAGHDCTTASETGTADLEDDDHTVYATDRAAVMVSCDRRFSQRRQRQAFGKHLYLRCAMPQVAEVLEGHLAEVLDTLQWAEHITVTVTVTEVSARFGWNPE